MLSKREEEQLISFYGAAKALKDSPSTNSVDGDYIIKRKTST
jgi:hypothetical protein